MSTYRVGDHHGVTIVREGDGARCGRPDHDCDRGHLVGVMLTAEDAELVVEALNAAAEGFGRWCENETNEKCSGLEALERTPSPDPAWCHGGPTLAGAICGRTDAHGPHEPADSCTCTKAGPDPACPVHQGRRARGPKPPPLGEGCICDGSGRTCPRHGAVI